MMIKNSTELSSTPNFYPLRRIISLLAAACILVVPAVASGLTTISQGYTTKDKLTTGSIVSLKNNTSDEVNAATTANVSGLLGVVINSVNSQLSFGNSDGSQVQVSTSGAVPVLVSNINGDIDEGDEITASPISGVGMKATSNIKVIGIAQDSLKADNGSKTSYTDVKGQKHDIVLGQIPLLVNVSYYYVQPDKTIIPSALQNVANALAGKKVDTLPILISAGIFLVTLIVLASMAYAMIRSSIISVGRNPMSQSAVNRGVIQLSALAVGILGVAVVSIYMILTRF